MARPDGDGGGVNDQASDPTAPMSEEEYRYAEAYRDHLGLGEPEPDDSHLDLVRAALIRGELRNRWRQHVERINRRA